MFTVLSSFVSRFRTPHAAMSAQIAPPVHSAVSAPRLENHYIRVSERAVPQIRQAAGITQFDLVELITSRHFRVLRERAIDSTGAWATTPQARAALADKSRDLHLLVFDPEREALIVAFAKADPDGERLTVTRVVTAQQYQQSRWQLLPIELCRDLCAQSIGSPQERDRILTAALGDRSPDNLPIIFSLQTDKRAVWVEIIERDGRERRLGILPFEFKKMAAATLPDVDAFWSWMQSTRDAEASAVTRDTVAAVRFVAYNDPYEQTVPVNA